MTAFASRLLRSRRVWALAIIAVLAWAAFVQVAAHLRARGRLRQLDPGMPYLIELGRGSGLDGLDTIAIRQDGTATLQRMRREDSGQFERATIQLAPSALADVLRALDESGVLGLYREYHEPGVCDGTQWVLWVRQGQDETSVYCDNHFPKPMVRFAAALDRILDESGLERAEWRRVPDADATKHDQDLWDSIRR
jgi:hypothetical protein